MQFDERIVQELEDYHRKMQEKGELLSNEQLTKYYTTFRNKFGPDKLKNLDGEALLDTMHGSGNRDSLMYWLEFKDDDEFHSPWFGSIAGGSSFKLGLFRRKETGIWTAGSPQKPVELTVEQAILRARQHRDQLLKGVELLDKLPTNGSDEDYGRLQREMEQVAPDISDLAWGHKYFSLLYPDKLDDFHNDDYQRFHLIKLLQLPPNNGGRYSTAGRFVALSRVLAISMNSLTTMLNERDGSTPYNYWRIGTTGFYDKEDLWGMMRDTNRVAIGWAGVHDLSTIASDATGKDAIREALLNDDPSMNHIAAGKAVQQLFTFRWTIAQGDLVLASNGATVLGIGRVIGDYVYDASSHFPHTRSVEWLSLDQWQQPDQLPGIEGKLTTVYKMKRPENLLEAEMHIYGATPIVSQPEPDNGFPTSPLLPPSRLTGIPARFQEILERKGQMILYGPPGTGKTHWAEVAARELAARSYFSRSFDQLTKVQQATLLGNDDGRGMVRMCSFHPAYGYEDFLEGFRPETMNGNMQFTLRDGIFKKLCNDARRRPDQKFYLIIDEINRGDIPRIFGELLSVIEKSKRGKSILLPLTGTTFRVPDNVYVIGTMNTADRSIALLDTALRRRFGFIELMPDSTVLGDAVVESIPLGPWLSALNERICAYVGRDARNLQIGHSYLLENGHPIGDFLTFARVLQDDILPLLEEYCYEDYSRLEKILGASLVDGQKQRYRHELFETANRDKLVQALLAPSPEITSSRPSIDSEIQAAKADEDERTFEEDHS